VIPMGNSGREGGNAAHDSTDSDFSPSPSRNVDAAGGDGERRDTGVNETPAPEGTAAAQQQQPLSARGGVRTAADDLDEFLPDDGDAADAPEDRGECPHCTGIRLTPFYGSRVGGADSDKVAFCFSCRSAFSRKDLHVRDVRRENRVYSAKIGAKKAKPSATTAAAAAVAQRSSVTPRR
jgi:hypothetical protein